MAETALFYANSGAGKTTLAVGLAKFVYEKWGLTTRLISADLGGWEPVQKEGLIDAGIVSAFNVAVRPNLLADTRKLSRGEWPKVVKEEVEGVLKSVRRMSEDKTGLAKVGLVFVEGCTSLSTAFLRHITKTDQKIGPEDVAGKYEEDGEQFGSNSRGHFNVVQTEMHGLFATFSALPVKYVFWTGHVGMGLVKSTGESCYAPQLAGGAKNAEVPSWVGDCFHLEDVPEVMNGGELVQEKEVRAYYVNHQDPETSKSYLCKSRVGPSDVAGLRERFPHGYVKLGVKEGEGIDQYYRWIEERKDKNLVGLKEWKERVDNARNKTQSVESNTKARLQ